MNIFRQVENTDNKYAFWSGSYAIDGTGDGTNCGVYYTILGYRTWLYKPFIESIISYKIHSIIAPTFEIYQL